MPDVSSLEPQIRAILTAPAVDLNTVSAKRVRAQLKQNNPELEDDWVRQNKGAIDQIIASVFDRVRAGEGDVPPAAASASATPTPSPPVTPAVGKRKRSVEEDADAEYARRLASELNGHKTRAGSAGAATKKKATGGKKKQKKSAEQIQESDEEDEEPAKPAKKPKKKRKAAVVEVNEDGTPKKKGGFQKEFSLRYVLAVVVNSNVS